MGRGNAGLSAKGEDAYLEPSQAVAKLVTLLLKGERGFVERWFKMSSPHTGGTPELMTPPDTFSWLLEAPGIVETPPPGDKGQSGFIVEYVETS